MRTRWGGVYERAAIPAGAYGLGAAVQTVSIPNYVVVDEHMDAGARPRPHASCCSTPPPSPTAPAPQHVIAPVGLHPGAQDYYDRAGP